MYTFLLPFLNFCELLEELQLDLLEFRHLLGALTAPHRLNTHLLLQGRLCELLPLRLWMITVSIILLNTYTASETLYQEMDLLGFPRISCGSNGLLLLLDSPKLLELLLLGALDHFLTCAIHNK
jgi:hypothetical protein